MTNRTNAGSDGFREQTHGPLALWETGFSTSNPEKKISRVLFAGKYQASIYCAPRRIYGSNTRTDQDIPWVIVTA
jgi:hypothetical protein